MDAPDLTPHELTPDVLVRAYCAGIFPMGDDRSGAVRWYAPDPRGILPLGTEDEDGRGGFHVPGTLARLVRQGRFRVTFDAAFDRVIAACAERERTWITPRLQRAYGALHRAGAAHSVEVWSHPGGGAGSGEASDENAHDGTQALVGGLYGVALGGAFFGESMFFRASNASKIALVHLVRRLRGRGYRLLDTQYGNAHLEQFGGVEIPRSEYQRRLGRALRADVTWDAPPDDASDDAPDDSARQAPAFETPPPPEASSSGASAQNARASQEPSLS